MGNQLSLFSHLLADDAKRDGMALVEAHNLDWVADTVSKAIRWIPAGTRLMGTDIRRRIGIYVDEPTSPNAWGAVVRQLIMLKVLRALPGEFRKSSAVRNHSHKYQVYEKVR